MRQNRVALRKESVDRNHVVLVVPRGCWLVALRKESVDRNITRGQLPTPEPPSLSARRAWIEILLVYLALIRYLVALRKESVDRNIFVYLLYNLFWLSLSARRAWIEIGVDFAEDWLDASLSARRAWIEIRASTTTTTICTGRSPQGERG